MTGRKIPQRVCRHVASASLLVMSLVAISLLPLLSPVFGATASAAASAETPAEASPLAISLTAVTPNIAVPQTPIKIAASVRNTSGDSITAPTASAYLGDRPLASRHAVSEWATPSDTQSRTLTKVAGTSLGRTLAPGSVARFTLTIPAKAISYLHSFAILPLSVEVVGTAPAGAQRSSATRTFLPTLATVKAFEPLSIAWLVPLTLDPDPTLHGPPSVARTAAWSKAVGPSSRLSRLIQGTENANVTWAIDPAILGPRQALPGLDASTAQPKPTANESQDSAAGSVATSDPVTETTSALARRLRAAVTSGPGHTLWSLPYTDPDLAALLPLPAGNRVLTPLMSRTSALSTTVGRARTDIAWPVEGTLTPQTQTRLRRAFKSPGLRGAVTSASTLTSADGSSVGASHKASSGIPLLAYDEPLSRTVAQTSSKASGAITIQRFLADSMALLGERPGTRNRSVLVAEPRTFAGDPAVLRSLFAAVAKAPWLIPATTGQLLTDSKKLTPDAPLPDAGADPTAPPSSPTSSPPSSPPSSPTSSPRSPVTSAPPAPVTSAPTAPEEEPAASDPLNPGASPLTSDNVTTQPDTLSAIAGIASILSDGRLFATSWTDAQVQKESVRWRGHPRGLATIDTATEAAISSISHRVKVAPSAVNFFADEGVLQVTVVNELDVPVHDVHLALTPAQPRLRIKTLPGPLKIGAKSRANVPLQVTSIAAGLVNVEAVLTTPNGTALGQDASVTVRVQPPSTWIYWGLGGLAGLILVLGTYRSLRRGSTRAADPDAQGAPLHD